MSQHLPASTPPHPGRPRSRRARVGLTSSAALVGVAAVLMVTGCSAGQASTSADVTALELPAAGGPAAMCAELTPQTLASADRAFAGKVVSLEDGRAVLEVTRTYTGDVASRVSVPEQAADEPSELSAGPFEQGRAYLISTQGDVVLTCGQSGPQTPQLQALYEQAY